MIAASDWQWQTKLCPELLSIATALPRYDFSNVQAIRLEAEMLGRALRARPHVRALEENVEVFDDVMTDPQQGGLSVRLRWYRPKLAKGAIHTMVYYHGGGFMIGNLDFEHHRCLRLAASIPCNIMACDYRLSPEHPFPAAFLDCHAAFLHARKISERDFGTSDLLIGGASCGGGLAAAVCLKLLAEGVRLPLMQMLIYPVLDNRMTTRSMKEAVGTPGWSYEASRKMWKNYLSQPVTLPIHYACPGRAENLVGLPPTYLLTAELDPLRDEGLDFAGRLLHAGVSVELRHYARTFHGFDALTGVSIAEEAMADQVRAVRRLSDHVG